MCRVNLIDTVRKWRLKEESDSTILLERRSVSSVFKTFYLVIFIVTTWKVSVFIENECANLLLTNNWFFWLPFVFFWVFLFHMLRLYVSLEQLEDPLTDLHQNYIRPLSSNRRRFFEQFLRFFVMVLVSLKGFEIIFMGNQLHIITSFIEVHPRVVGLAEIFLYLTALYSAMLLWDIFMKLWGGKKWNETFWEVSLVGFCISLYFMYVIASTDKAHVIPSSNLEFMRLLMVALIAATMFSLFRGKSVLKAIREVPASIAEVLEVPYYGRHCNIVVDQYANVKPSDPAVFHGNKCTSTSCDLSKKTQQVIIPEEVSR